ncbi:MAG: aldehyde dehydrogenase family protein, partial [Tropicimonas sp.]|uniref:aldehyde dehydrogenase family protein n=1 Tax=Tropicimonas sp. TaxID=2067044 RepID=UPI003A83DDD8
MKMLMAEGWVDAGNGATRPVINPATGETIDTVPDATIEDVQRAISQAIESQHAWAALSLRERTERIRKAAVMIRERRLELGKVLSVEAGKPLMAEAVWEFDSVAYVLEASCEVAKHHYGETMPFATEPGYDEDLQFTIYGPRGVIACIVPYNFPPAIWSFKVGAALAAGNAVIVKAPSYDPLGVLKCHEILLEAGIPAGVIQCLTGSGGRVGGALVADPRIDSINFTGSTETGITIAKQAAEHLTPCYFELGGNDGLIIMDDADMDLAVSESGDKSRNSGQACSAAKRFIVHNSIKKRFAERLIDERLSKLVLGDPLDPETTMGPMIGKDAADEVAQQVDHTVTQGGRILFGGKRRNSYAFYEPTVIEDVTPDMDIARDMEVFGPVWPIIGFDTVEEAIAIHNNSRYGLGGGVMTPDMKLALQIARRLKTGHVAINASGGFRAAELPFGGGTKASGNSRESMSEVMREVSQQKSIILRYVF